MVKVMSMSELIYLFVGSSVCLFFFFFFFWGGGVGGVGSNFYCHITCTVIFFNYGDVCMTLYEFSCL